MAFSKPRDKTPLVASVLRRNFCRFCGKEDLGRTFLDLQRNEDHYAIAVQRLEYMNIKPAKKINMNICKPCYDAFNAAYTFCHKFNRTQIRLVNIYTNQEEDNLETQQSAPSKRPLVVKTELESADELDVEKVNEVLPPCSKRMQVVDSNKSWRNYTWTCCHCDAAYKKLASLRSHSINKHKICYAFECPDCDVKLNQYVHFIEHVRNHKENLRYYCDVCDKPIEENGRHNHEIGGAMCSFCGEILEDASSLMHHQETYKKQPAICNEGDPDKYIITVPDLQLGNVYPECHAFQSWKDYVWVCNKCEIKFHSANAIRYHSKTVHNTCFSMKCVDCNATASTFHTLITHIMRHRPSLRHFCLFCDRLTHSEAKFRAHVRHHLTNSGYCPECGEVYPGKVIEDEVINDDSMTFFWFLEPAGRSAVSNDLIETNQATEFIRVPIPEFASVLVEESDDDVDINEDNSNEEATDSGAETEDAGERTEGLSFGDADPIDYTLQTPSSCLSCEETFTDKRLYRQHTDTSYCPICDANFNCLLEKEEHLSDVHLAEKPYECYKCGRCHFTMDRAYDCMESHLAYETEMCNTCRSMVLSSYLKEHEELHNYIENPIAKACGVGYCPLKFASWMDRVNHRHAKHQTITFRKMRACGRYLIQRNILGLLPMSEVLPVQFD